MKRCMLIFLCVTLVIPLFAKAAPSEELSLDVPYAILIDASGGEVLYEKEADKQVPIASVTKVMTMLLIMEAIHGGKISMEDTVTASEYACSMGGSQVYLEPGEQMPVKDMIKCIAVASANDCCVAMAEHIMGSNEGFVRAMNERAKSLGMKNTNFINCNGLDEDGHYSSARDVAIMSRELLKHEEIRPFLTIWMDSIRDGKFGLANTNKLLKSYSGAIGIKTGSTSKAKYCLSSAAERDGLCLIGVILGADSTQLRFANAKKLLDYGFANYANILLGEEGTLMGKVSVYKGVEEEIEGVLSSTRYKLVAKGDKAKIEQEINLPDKLNAPVKKGDKIGEVIYKADGKAIDKADIVAARDIKKLSVFHIFASLLRQWTGAV